jgi:hypothetical protein
MIENSSLMFSHPGLREHPAHCLRMTGLAFLRPELAHSDNGGASLGTVRLLEVVRTRSARVEPYTVEPMV